MIDFTSSLYEIVIWIFLLYSGAILVVYSWIGIYAYGALNKYRHKNLFTDYNLIVTNPNVPKFSLVAPAYNEGMTIVENVRSLLSLYYNNLEIIIVNDGSKDNSIPLLIEAYQLEATHFFVQGEIPTKAIKAIYRSKNPAFKKLIVVDKENGGKADALNVGINISDGEYLVCIDVDCILEQDAILKLAKPFLEQTDKRVIACGGVIRLANNCEVKDGKITDVRLPESWLGRCQALEYIRAFVLGRMAWSRASGLILISGAFGAFNKEIVLACGGYDSKTVGEDMELVVRMRRYMEEQNEPYEVVNIPDPLCWTEVPESKEILRRQRNRWMRGTIETLWKHRTMMLNPRYGKLGMVSLPYWFLFEFLGPVIEYLGYIVFIIFFLLGIINWQFFFALFALVIASGILYSIFAILVDLMSHQVYTKKVDLSKLVTAAIIEPFYFHPIVVKASVKGLVDYFGNQHGWGEMTRQGFAKKNQNLPFWQRVYGEVKEAVNEFTWPAITFFVLTMLTTFVEYKWYNFKLSDIRAQSIGVELLANNVDYALQTLLVIGVLYILVRFVFPERSKTLLLGAFTSLILLHFLLFLYYGESRNLLGSDAFIYGTDEVIHILESSGMLNITNVAFCVLVVGFVMTLFILGNRKTFDKPFLGFAMLALGLMGFLVNPSHWLDSKTESIQNAITSKCGYFFNANSNEWIESNEHYIPHWISKNNVENFDPNFPFLKEESTKDFLGDYFNESSTPPNLVLVIVEGLGHAYSSPNGYVGNFTPYLDSLTRKSLYWEYTLSTSGRTFAAIPSITGSLPFGKSGFLEMQPQPKNFNLFNIFQRNSFNTSFYYGGDSEFDRMKEFISANRGVEIIDQDSFSSSYRKLPGNGNESWGYEDQAVFKKILDSPINMAVPAFKVALTLSTHNPFLINDSEIYEKKFNKQLEKLNLPEEQRNWALDNKKALVSVINFDDAFKKFMEGYAKRDDYKNTIFIITGDHAMPEIPFQEKINRYHVPLVIYSPLLKEPKAFKYYVSHFDIAPSVVAFYRDKYQLKVPEKVTWMGQGLSSSNQFGYPMMQSKSQLMDYIYRSYHLSDQTLFEYMPTLTGEPVQNEIMKRKISEMFETFKEKNKILNTTKQLMPDSVYNAYMD